MDCRERVDGFSDTIRQAFVSQFLVGEGRISTDFGCFKRV